MPGVSIVECRVAQCPLPLQLSRRKQISNVALNKPSQWSDLRVPGHSMRAWIRIIGRGSEADRRQESLEQWNARLPIDYCVQ